jgi:hypothetical protein
MAEQHSEDILSHLGTKAAEVLVSESVKLLIGPAASSAFTVLVRTGKILSSLWVDSVAPSSDNESPRELNGKHPPFSIIGLGRCGTHVTAQVARMVLDTLSTRDADERKQSSPLARLFGAKSDPQFTLEPLMIVGDLDPTTLREIRGLIAVGKDGASTPEGEQTFKRILKIGYDPLSVSGAGHLPIVAEFITRCLLALPVEERTAFAHPWGPARRYLLNSSLSTVNPTRMVFYVFSAGGGSGSGSAPELLRAQRISSFASGNPDPEMYFCGVAVIPYDQVIMRYHKLNTGRFFVQYLADLCVRLPDKSYYLRAMEYDFSVTGKLNELEKPIQPWNGLAVISNDTLRPAEDHSKKEQVDQNVNQYIAQQIFNLASGQISVLSYEGSGNVQLNQLNFQSVRMDPADLKNGLVGPFAVGFSVSQSPPTTKDNWIDALLIKALADPGYLESIEPAAKTGFVQGLSISPEVIGSPEQNAYNTLVK